MVRSELAASVAKPGGNITGINIVAEDLNIKRLEILHEPVAGARRIGTLVDPRLPPQQKLETAARQLGLDLISVTVSDPEEITGGLDMLASVHVGAVNVLDSPLIYAARASIIERLKGLHLPASYAWPEIAEEGGFLGYGARLRVYFRQMVRLVSRILSGGRPQDLPIEQPGRYDLVVNLKTAQTLGLTIPGSILARADEIIE